MSHREGLIAANLLQKTARAAGWCGAEMNDAGLAAGEPLFAAAPAGRGVRLPAEPGHRISTGSERRNRAGAVRLYRGEVTLPTTEIGLPAGLALFNPQASLAVNS